MVTEERPWYRFWSERPVFDPVTFRTDLERLRRNYEANGYYEAAIAHDLQIDEERGLVAVQIKVREGEPVLISEIDVQARVEAPEQAPPLPDELPVRRGEIFREQSYQEAEQVLRRSFLEHGHAHVETRRHAEVDLDDHQVRIRYGVEPGPVAFFGETEVKGVTSVEPEIVSRELAYNAGERYSLSKIVESRERILALDLFGTVRLASAAKAGKPVVVPMEVEVSEKPFREVRVGLGYSTEDEFRTQLEWRHRNWFGGGRRLSVLGKYSAIAASGAIGLVQPHFFSRDTQGALNLSHDLETEETYKRNVSRFLPRVDHRFSKTLTGFIGYRMEYNQLNDVDSAIPLALGEVRHKGFLFGPTVGIIWNTSDDLFYPRKGHLLSLQLDQAGEIWGSEFSFLKITGEARKYIDIGWSTVLASRLKLAFAEAIGSDKDFPLFERLYAGGERSVRGYGRRRLGPRTISNDPLGGRSLLEGSLELRRPIWQEIHGAVFIDFGQVSTSSFDVPLDNVRFSGGFGLSYVTPVGPIRLDVGFPFTPPPGDRPWQIHFSIGAYF